MVKVNNLFSGSGTGSLRLLWNKGRKVRCSLLLFHTSEKLSFFFCGRPCDMELVIRQSERSGHQQRLLQALTEDVFIFSLLVYIAH